MHIGDLVDSEIMQLYPFEFAKSLYENFWNAGGDSESTSTCSVNRAVSTGSASTNTGTGTGTTDDGSGTCRSTTVCSTGYG